MVVHRHGYHDEHHSIRGPSPCIASLLAAAPLHAASRPPNVVIIFADDQGYADVGCFGATGFATPNLDRLAREGRRFTNFHVAQPVCSASRAALLTGCYPNRIGIHGALGPEAKHGIADGEMTLAEMLKPKGYATGMAGKWHLGHHPRFLPVHHGFDEYLGLPYSNDMWPHHPEAKPGAYPPLPLIEGDDGRRRRGLARGPAPAHRPGTPSAPSPSSSGTRTAPSSSTSRIRCRTCRSP